MDWSHFASIQGNQTLCETLLERALEQCYAAYPFLRTYMQWEQRQLNNTIDTLKRHIFLSVHINELQLQLHHQAIQMLVPWIVSQNLEDNEEMDIS